MSTTDALPPLPEPINKGGTGFGQLYRQLFNEDQMHAYALAAIAAAHQEDSFERGRQLGMQQEHALWQLSASSQEIEQAAQRIHFCAECERLGRELAALKAEHLAAKE